MQEWPEDLFDFAWFPNRDVQLHELASLAEDEDWQYRHSPSDHEYPILFNYLRYTYQKLAEDREITLSINGDFSCFNTGLVTGHQEPLFASFEVNRWAEARQQWYFKGWFRKGERELSIFSTLPDIPQYFDDPAKLILDTRKDLRVNVEHIVEESRERFPERYRSMNDYMLNNLIEGAIERAKARTKRNYKTAIPQYYHGRIQLLLPLCLDSPRRADLALVVEDLGSFYRAATCLTLDMAYNNARRLVKPDRDWLQP